MNIGVGLALGVVFGLALDNLALGLCLGVAIGAGFEAQSKRKEGDEDESA